MNEYEKSPLEESTEDLYKRDAPSIKKVINRSLEEAGQDGEATPPVPPQNIWQKSSEPKKVFKVPVWFQKEQPLFKKLFFAALIFLVLSIGVAIYLYVKGTNTISANNIDIAVNAPISVSSNTPFSLDVSVQNKNTEALVDTEIEVDYPEGTKYNNQDDKVLITDTVSVGNVSPREIVKKHFEGVFVGQEGDVKKIKIIFKYHIPDSNSIFVKDLNYEIKLSSAPVIVLVENVKELNSNQPISFKIKISSNTEVPIKNVVLKVTYPFGFTFVSATPELYSKDDNTKWLIPELQGGESKDFTINGILLGQKNEDKNFNFTVGSIQDQNQADFSTVFVKTDSLVKITNPFITSKISFGTTGTSSENFSPGEVLSGVISYANNLSVPITDSEIVLSIRDPNNLIKKDDLKTDRGLYNSVSNTITWNKLSFDNLESLNPGEVQKVNFAIPTILLSAMNKKINNQTINFDLVVKGKRVNENNVPEEISTIDTKTVKFKTELNLGGRAVYHSGPFANAGPIPPKANVPTTYTVIWSLTNALNNVSGGKVVATLPPYVSFEGSISPDSEKISYDKNKNQVSWNVGALPYGLGYINSPRQVAFKIILTPLLTQVLSNPILINKATFTGIDDFTGLNLQDSVNQLDTELDTDSNIKKDDGRVIK